MDAHGFFDGWWWMLVFYVFSAAAHALPPPEEENDKFYRWFYSFVHGLLANWDKVRRVRGGGDHVK